MSFHLTEEQQKAAHRDEYLRIINASETER